MCKKKERHTKKERKEGFVGRDGFDICHGKAADSVIGLTLALPPKMFHHQKMSTPSDSRIMKKATYKRPASNDQIGAACRLCLSPSFPLQGATQPLWLPARPALLAASKVTEKTQLSPRYLLCLPVLRTNMKLRGFLVVV